MVSEQFQEPAESASRWPLKVPVPEILPTSLRFQIFRKSSGSSIRKKALPGPRIVELDYRHGDRDAGGYLYYAKHFISSCTIPVILPVCRSLVAGLINSNELLFPTIDTNPKVYFSPSIETIVLSWRGVLANTSLPMARSGSFDVV
jgi:hypothetical protein